jgi:cold shock CspA family protein
VAGDDKFRLQRGETRDGLASTHPIGRDVGASALTGQVALIEPGVDHGFILNSVGSQLYFHCDSVTNGRFEDLKQGDVVHYVEEEGDAGPVATKVRLANSEN